MMVIPAGSYMMGVVPGEEAREEVPEELRGWVDPRHRVTIGKSFAMGKYEVTRGEFAAFVRDSGHRASGACWYNDSATSTKKDYSHSWRDPGLSQTDTSSSGVGRRDVTQARRMRQTCVQGTGCATKAAKDWPKMHARISGELWDSLALRIHYVSLENAEFEMGSEDKPPKLTGECRLAAVGGLDRGRL